MRELAVQSTNGTMSSDDLAATDAEYQNGFKLDQNIRYNGGQVPSSWMELVLH